ncbi:hypothetical protein A2Z33_01860 [Candidatus Gottesmanbacteria bacterium RBG_16_52_11]|uniref:Uncharacterized protein n=1 Tax=Candidatus Gottesmanbacteria bacterium RBG_16_52_11 TaxID=1798374 RepID=A0A1F5YR28_9BACT|nr:MAG: hypothetical protein A2Z33_01860 [Candidatus Gottesmanbacteria bacterium RBG_16_52_11]
MKRLFLLIPLALAVLLLAAVVRPVVAVLSQPATVDSESVAGENTEESGTATTAGGCIIGGCSNQYCLTPGQEPRTSTCQWRNEYACYKDAVCERQANGACGWTQTPELTSCLGGGGTQPSAPPVCGNNKCEWGEADGVCPACKPGQPCPAMYCEPKPGTCPSDCPGSPTGAPVPTGGDKCNISCPNGLILQTYPCRCISPSEPPGSTQPGGNLCNLSCPAGRELDRASCTCRPYNLLVPRVWVQSFRDYIRSIPVLSFFFR